MATITEDYVRFETAKLLKEKGFDEKTLCKYAGKDGITEEWYDHYSERMVDFNWGAGHLIEPLTRLENNYAVYGKTIPAPTLQMATKWLRNTHNLFIFISTWLRKKDGTVQYYYEIRNLNDEDFETIAEFTIPEFDSPEKACEAALKYCLDNLI